MWLYIGISIFIVVIIILISNIELKVQRMKNVTNQKIAFEVRALLGIIRLNFEMPEFKFKGIKEGVDLVADIKLEQLDKNVADFKEKVTVKKVIAYYHDLKNLREHVYQYSKWFSSTISHIKCDLFRWYTVIGTGDAPSTAITTGLIWAVKSSLIGFLSNKINFTENPEVRVNPQYNQLNFSTDFIFKLKFRLIHGVLALLFLFFRILRVKDGLKVWRKTLVQMYSNIRDKKKKSMA